MGCPPERTGKLFWGTTKCPIQYYMCKTNVNIFGFMCLCQNSSNSQSVICSMSVKHSLFLHFILVHLKMISTIVCVRLTEVR